MTTSSVRTSNSSRGEKYDQQSDTIAQTNEKEKHKDGMRCIARVRICARLFGRSVGREDVYQARVRAETREKKAENADEPTTIFMLAKNMRVVTRFETDDRHNPMIYSVLRARTTQ